MNQKNLLEVDWSKIPAPTDDGAAAHLVGMTIPPISLVATDDTSVTLSALPGRTVVFAYPRTGEPGKISLVDDWDMIPGARGCTPQTCAFRDLFAELKAAGAAQVFGLSTQSNAYQTEMASRLHLPFPVLSDEKLELTRALDLPTMEVAGLTLIKRLALIVDDARITHVFYPVFPPDRNAGDVLAWLKENPDLEPPLRHARACPGHPRSFPPRSPWTWMAGTSPAMTRSAFTPNPPSPWRTRCGTCPASAPAYWCCNASSDSCRKVLRAPA